MLVAPKVEASEWNNGTTTGKVVRRGGGKKILSNDESATIQHCTTTSQARNIEHPFRLLNNIFSMSKIAVTTFLFLKRASRL